MEKYNLPHEEVKRFEVYHGRNVQQMPKLIADSRVPVSVAGLMQRRLDVRNSDQAVKSSYIDNYFDTGDAVVYHPDGRVKIVLDSQTLREMTPETPRDGGALLLGEDIYDALQGEEFKKDKLGKTGNFLTKEEVKAHPVWKVLARDHALLDDYADYIFAEGKERSSYNTAMGVYPDSAGNDVKMRAWCVYRLGYRSGANGRLDLGYDFGRLLGFLAPEALSAQGIGVSNIKAYTMADLQAFDSAMKGLEGVLNPNVLKPFTQLRKKL